jgi:TRAP-type C4-dicarboxylate transport system substrate-binding protein
MFMTVVRHKVTAYCAIAAAAAMLAAGCSSSKAGSSSGTSTAGGKTYTLRVSLHEATIQGDPISEAAQKFADEASALSHGQLQVKLYLNSQLGVPSAVYQQINAGQNLMDWGQMETAGNYYPGISALDLPYIVNNEGAAEKALEGSLGPSISNTIAQATGFRILGFFAFGWDDIVADKPISTPSDLRGLKIRTSGTPTSNDEISALGAIPQKIDSSEVYLALQQHTVDGSQTADTLIYSAKYWQPAKYLALIHSNFVFGEATLSESWLKSLPAGLQADLQKAMTIAESYNYQLYDNIYATDVAAMRAAGVHVEQPDQALFNAAEQSVVTKYKNKLGSPATSWIEQLSTAGQ